MSLGIVIRGPEGLVFAAESRVTLYWNPPGKPPNNTTKVDFDTAKKLLTFKEPHNYIGAVTFGRGAIGNRTAYSFVSELQTLLPQGRVSVKNFTEAFYRFFLEKWRDQGWDVSWKNDPITEDEQMKFIIGGYDSNNEPYGRAYEIWIPGEPKYDKEEKKWVASGPTYKELEPYGINYGGLSSYVDRILKGYDYKLIKRLCWDLSLDEDKVKEIKKDFEMKIPYEAMGLQDYVDLAILLVRTTIEAQRLTADERGCGGPIDVVTINQREGVKNIQQKALEGERTPR